MYDTALLYTGLAMEVPRLAAQALWNHEPAIEDSGAQRTHTILCTCGGMQCPGRPSYRFSRDIYGGVR